MKDKTKTYLPNENLPWFTLSTSLLVAILIALSPSPLPAQQPAPHIFFGDARIDGELVPPGTKITAYDETGEIAFTHTREQGQFLIGLVHTYSIINLKVAGFPATRTFYWKPNTFLRLNAYTAAPPCQVTYPDRKPHAPPPSITFQLRTNQPPDCHEGIVPVPHVISSANGQIEAVFTFDNKTKKWLFYDPELPQVSDLQEFAPGRPYFILITSDLGIYLNYRYRELTCSNGNCWNLIVW